MIGFFDIMRLKGFPIAKAKKMFNSICMEDNLLEWQNQKEWEIFNYHFDHTDIYRSYVKEKPKSWSDIPIVTKDLLKEQPIENIKSTNKDKKFFLRQTSGSTGQPLTYAIDYLNHSLTWLLIADRYNSAGVNLNDKQARFYGSPLSIFSRVKENIKDFVSNRYRFPILDLSDNGFEVWIKKFQSNKYKYIYGYAYPISSFARFLKNRGILLKDICPTLKACIITSEMCSDEDHALIEESFGIDAYNEYGCSEMGIIAFGKNGNWIVSDELIYIEIVDDDDNILPNGKMGRVICTPLFNLGTPFVRYDLGDLATLDETNNRKYISSLMGRQEEMAILPSGKKTPGDTAFYYIFKQFAHLFNGIKEYKVYQKSIDTFEIKIVSEKPLTQSDEIVLKSYTYKFLERGINIIINRVDYIERTKMGKFRRFVSELPD